MRIVEKQTRSSPCSDRMPDFTRFCESQGLDVDETCRILKAHAASRDEEEYTSIVGLIDQTAAYA
jgi:hypothetical protein